MIIGTHMFPNFIGLTWENQKTSFSIFLTFRDPNGVPKTLQEPVFSQNKTLERRICNRVAMRAKRAEPTRLDSLVMWGLPIPPLLLWCRRSSSCWMHPNLKPSIKRPPCGSQKGAPPKHKNTKQERGRLKIGGEYSGRVLPMWSPSPLTTLPSSPWWRGSSPPLDYGFVAS
jgi:hypothetical protein